MAARWEDDRLCLEGEFDLDNAATFRDEVDRAIAGDRTELVLDAAALTFCDSTCLACILRALQAGLRVRIVNSPPMLRRTLAVSGIDLHRLLVIES